MKKIYINLLIGIILLFGVSKLFDYITCGINLKQNLYWGINVCGAIGITGWIGVANLFSIIFGIIFLIKGIVGFSRKK
jgi:hypothetical protein